MEKEIHIPFTQIRMGRFLFLLLSILLIFILQPFLRDFIALSLLMEIFITAILISAVYAAGRKRSLFITAFILAALTALTRWSDQLLHNRTLAVLEEFLTLFFFGFMVVVILVYLFREKEVTSDLIMGSICGYFLLGFLWSSLYSLLEIFKAGSFQIPEIIYTETSPFNYYSFVTLTTLGYGDVTPISSPAQSFSVLEAVAGQLFIAILISRLVAIHVAQSQKK
jgi:hypothetical protein